MTWHDPKKINTKDYTVSNCGRGLLYNNHHNSWIFLFVIGAFFNKRARETSAAKASLGAFPPIRIAPKNAKLKLAVAFTRASRLFFHAAIYQCFDNFNRSGGTVVTLQNGIKMNMAKAIILAIFCDHPAARKCCLCGSACPQCFTSEVDFAKPPMDGTMEIRTPRTVAAKKIVRFNVCFNVSFIVSFNICCNTYWNVRLMYDLMYILIYIEMYDLILF